MSCIITKLVAMKDYSIKTTTDQMGLDDFEDPLEPFDETKMKETLKNINETLKKFEQLEKELET